MHRNRGRRTQRGNILFLILLAVALFAALNYAVTNSMRGGGKSASAESMKVKAAEIIQYANLLENTVNRLILVNGCDPSQISFENDTTNALGLWPSNKLDFRNPRAPSDKRCHVFDTAGGELYYLTLEDEFLDPTSSTVNTVNHHTHGYTYFTASVFASRIGTDPKADLFLVIPWLTNELCLAINDSLGRGTGTPSTLNNMTLTLPFGPNNFNDAGQAISTLTSQHSYCGRYAPFTPYMLYHVVLAR